MMKKEDIITLPNPHLREKSERVHVITDDVKKTIKDMIFAAVDWENSRPHEISAALAAIQIDCPLRIVVIRSDFEDKDNRDFIALINPEIIKYEGDIVEDYEGCLSVNDVYGKVPRYNKIRVKALDIDGNEVKFKAEGFLARTIQHEVEHTKGIVFVDKIRNSKKAFYRLDNKGDLKPIDYDKEIKSNNILWN
jgi:peptide deformylase